MTRTAIAWTAVGLVFVMCVLLDVYREYRKRRELAKRRALYDQHASRLDTTQKKFERMNRR